MIDVFHATDALLKTLQDCSNERELIRQVESQLTEYEFASSVQHSELDIAYAAAGGPSTWLEVSVADVNVQPSPPRDSGNGDILVERQSGFVHLSTPAGFIPLVDVVVSHQRLQKKVLN